MAKRSYEPPKMTSNQVFREAVLSCGYYNNIESQPQCMKQVAGVCDAVQWSFPPNPCSTYPSPNVS